jgi:hypothetical protein
MDTAFLGLAGRRGGPALASQFQTPVSIKSPTSAFFSTRRAEKNHTQLIENKEKHTPFLDTQNGVSTASFCVLLSFALSGQSSSDRLLLVRDEEQDGEDHHRDQSNHYKCEDALRLWLAASVPVVALRFFRHHNFLRVPEFQPKMTGRRIAKAGIALESAPENFLELRRLDEWRARRSPGPTGIRPIETYPGNIKPTGSASQYRIRVSKPRVVALPSI